MDRTEIARTVGVLSISRVGEQRQRQISRERIWNEIARLVRPNRGKPHWKSVSGRYRNSWNKTFLAVRRRRNFNMLFGYLSGKEVTTKGKIRRDDPANMTELTSYWSVEGDLSVFKVIDFRIKGLAIVISIVVVRWIDGEVLTRIQHGHRNGDTQAGYQPFMIRNYLVSRTVL